MDVPERKTHPEGSQYHPRSSAPEQIERFILSASHYGNTVPSQLPLMSTAAPSHSCKGYPRTERQQKPFLLQGTSVTGFAIVTATRKVTDSTPDHAATCHLKGQWQNPTVAPLTSFHTYLVLPSPPLSLQTPPSFLPIPSFLCPFPIHIWSWASASFLF